MDTKIPQKNVHSLLIGVINGDSIYKYQLGYADSPLCLDWERPILLGGMSKLFSLIAFNELLKAKEIGFVKRNQDNFLIVCVAATLKILEKYEIIADIIITSDSSTIIKEQFNVDKKYYINSLIFASNKTDNSVIDLLLKENIFLFNDSLEIFDETGVNTGVNVGNIGYSILLKLGIETIYLLGFDASVNPETGRSHSSNNNKKEFKEFNLNNDEKINSEIHLIKVKGNFEDFVCI